MVFGLLFLGNGSIHLLSDSFSHGNKFYRLASYSNLHVVFFFFFNAEAQTPCVAIENCKWFRCIQNSFQIAASS